ncbi:hypothetical protein, partial [Flagellimonas flava]|uniref:hypothetical protein n=1 Tax=Flagellimonas flava TaxID=570519 RepID=UPI003D655B2D
LTQFGVNSWLIDNAKEVMSVNGRVFNRNNEQELNLFANFTGFQLEPCSPLGDGVISHIRGRLDGNTRVVGNLDNPSI